LYAMIGDLGTGVPAILLLAATFLRRRNREA
jgi:hypothetical protein